MNDSSLILMATYNGERYIDKQIESIISQSFRNWHLIIRDDGSLDKTIQIIEKYVLLDKRIELIVNKTERHGAYLNFWTLISEARKKDRYDYYFFADQDDVWPMNRMQWMINAAKRESSVAPLLVYGDMQIIDGAGEILHNSLNEIMGIGQMSGLTEYYSSGFVWGCNAMINNELFDKTPIFPLDNSHIKIMSHDNYYTKYALSIGKVKFIDKVCIQHRRYGSNTTGNYELKLSLLSVIKKATGEYSSIARTHALGYVQTLETIAVMKRNGQANENVLMVEKAINQGGLYGVKTLIKQKVKRKQFFRTVGIYLIMLLKSYQKYMAEY